jgi:hypothetical protein
MLVGMRESLVEVHYADVREQIMNMLLIEKRERAYDEMTAALRSVADIEYYDTSYEPDSLKAQVYSERDTIPVPDEKGEEH